MKIVRNILFLLCLVSAANSFAQADLIGTWEGELAISAENKMTVQLTISTDANGVYLASINSPDTGALKNVPADSVNVSDGELLIEFASLSGEFNGRLVDGNLSGQWLQLNESFALVLAPYTQAVMTEEDLAYLLGSWVGKLETSGIEVPIVFRFDVDDENELVGFFDSPIEGAFDLPISDIVFANSQLSLSLTFANVRYVGQVSEAGIDGTWSQNGQELPALIAKGEYENANKLVLDEASQEQLLGSWAGQLGPLTLKFRFEKNSDNDFLAFVDSPTQGVNGLLISEISLDGAKLNFSLLAPPAQFTGELNSDEIVGTWIQNGSSNPLTVTKE